MIIFDASPWERHPPHHQRWVVSKPPPPHHGKDHGGKDKKGKRQGIYFVLCVCVHFFVVVVGFWVRAPAGEGRRFGNFFKLIVSVCDFLNEDILEGKMNERVVRSGLPMCIVRYTTKGQHGGCSLYILKINIYICCIV